MIDNPKRSSHRNCNRGVHRLFLVLSVCWFIVAGYLVWPKWAAAIKAQHDAQVILDTSARNADGYFTAYNDEIEDPFGPGTTDPAPQVTTPDGKKVYPMRFHAWQEAAKSARQQRPLALTIEFVTVPFAVYGLMAIVLWVWRGFYGEVVTYREQPISIASVATAEEFPAPSSSTVIRRTRFSAVQGVLILLATTLVLSVSYYFAIALPGANRERLIFEKSRYEADKKEREIHEAKLRLEIDDRKRNRDACIAGADESYWSYVKLNGAKAVDDKPGVYTAPRFVWDEAGKKKAAAMAECNSLYGK